MKMQVQRRQAERNSSEVITAGALASLTNEIRKIIPAINVSISRIRKIIFRPFLFITTVLSVRG